MKIFHTFHHRSVPLLAIFLQLIHSLNSLTHKCLRYNNRNNHYSCRSIRNLIINRRGDLYSEIGCYSSISSALFSGSIAVPIDVNVLPDCKRRLSEITSRVQSNLARDVLDLPGLKQQLRDMEEESATSTFWDDTNNAQLLLSNLNNIKSLIFRGTKWSTDCSDISALIDLAIESPNDASKGLFDSYLVRI